ncbi:hypothetical protein [Phenylobacterium sp.]|jgi:hypothetical protein|uniref:hypothetical protein n=1 Tax=Phenylobacterium sp. TaxID=1871053 RepID=UPI002F95E791
MPAASRDLRRPALLIAASALALGLAGCRVDNRPLLARGEPDPGPAYAAQPLGGGYPYDLGPLDPAEPVRVVPVSEAYDGYALAERAYAYDRVAWQAPPDYGFRYGDEEPWAWETAGDELMFAEPLDDGYRFYYYEPGEAYPYFVRDPHYGYAYGDDGVLSAVFNAAGALLGADQLYGMAGIAGSYLTRGYDLHRVYYAEPRYALASDPVWYDRWEDRYPVLRSSWEPWMAAADRVEPWRAYRISTGGRELRAFEPELHRREKALAKLDRKLAKADEKAFRRAVGEERRELRVAHGPPAPAPRFEDRHGRDDHRGRGRGHDAERQPGREARPMAVAENRAFAPDRGPDGRGRGGGWKAEDRGGGGPGGHGGHGGGPGKGHGGGGHGGGDKGGDHGGGKGKGRD